MANASQRLGLIIVTLIVAAAAAAVGVGALPRMETFHVPSYRVTGEEADLFCYFRLDRDRQLYSLKWFKDGREIFRYQPENGSSTSSPITLNWVHGVNIDVGKSTMNRVHLKNLTQDSSGSYSCEVMQEHHYVAVRKEGEMTVLAGPTSDPELRGFASSVTQGDRLEGNCTLADAGPLLKLQFLINGVQVEEDYLEQFPPINFPSGRQKLTLGLNLPVEDRHWTRPSPKSGASGSHLELKCLATMEHVENVWMRVKMIQQASPTLVRRKSPRRQASLDPMATVEPVIAIAAVAAATNETSQTADEPAQPLVQKSSCDVTTQLSRHLTDLLSTLNRGLQNLTLVQAEQAARTAELVDLRREELAFLRALPKAPIRT